MIIVDPMRPVKRHTAAPEPTIAPLHDTRAQQKLPPQTVKEANSKNTLQKKRNIPWRIVVLVAMCGALLFIPEIIGQMLLIIYGIIAIVRRYKPHVTFILAVVFLVLSPVMNIAAGENDGGVLASYSFFFLVIGLLQLITEYRRMLNEKSAREG